MDGTFEEGPVCIVDSRDQVLRRKTVKLFWYYGGTMEWRSPRGSARTRRATYPFVFRDEGT